MFLKNKINVNNAVTKISQLCLINIDVFNFVMSQNIDFYIIR